MKAGTSSLMSMAAVRSLEWLPPALSEKATHYSHDSCGGQTDHGLIVIHQFDQPRVPLQRPTAAAPENAGRAIPESKPRASGRVESPHREGGGPVTLRPRS